MMKKEFEALVDKKITDNEYKTIEFVYSYHPSIINTTGKQQIADIYKTYGMLVIQDMVETATFARNLEIEKENLRKKLEIVEERMIDVKEGRLDFERCLSDIQKYFDKSEDLTEFNHYMRLFVEPNYSIAQIKATKEILGIKQ